MNFQFCCLPYFSKMNDNLDPTGNQFNSVEKEIEKVLRPTEFNDFSGQENIIENLKIFVQAAKHGKSRSIMCCCMGHRD